MNGIVQDYQPCVKCIISNINLKSWRVYLFQIDIIDLEAFSPSSILLLEQNEVFTGLVGGVGIPRFARNGRASGLMR
jgi:hypothetical protein